MDQTVQMEPMRHEIPGHGMPYAEPYMGYLNSEQHLPYQAQCYAPMQGMCYYDESYVTPRDDYMNTTCYQPTADDVSNVSNPGMFMYGDSPMTPMADFNSTMAYGPMDMTYCPTDNSTFYGTPTLAMPHVVGAAKGDFDDAALTFADCSTAATTPTLEPCSNAETIDDGFNLGYAYDINGPAMDPYANMMPSGNYYNGYHAGVNFEDAFAPCGNADAMVNDAIIVEIANEIAANVQYLPDKESSGKYSLDKKHPIHCVWRDLNRGHCSWRCRWWENGKRLSKNFNVKRFGEREAMWMAIAMKIRNSTPVERFQLLKEQREAVRNYCELSRQRVDGPTSETADIYASSLSAPSMGLSPRAKKSPISNAKSAQKANWARIAWTYVMVPERRAGDTCVVCRLCAKTTKCSRSRNLQQAHIMHLIRMHKNPWKKYLDVEGLTKMCRSALENLYQQQRFTADSEWKLRSGLTPPEPDFDYSSVHDVVSDEE